jgi:hypothetical protein
MTLDRQRVDDDEVFFFRSVRRGSPSRSSRGAFVAAEASAAERARADLA